MGLDSRPCVGNAPSMNSDNKKSAAVRPRPWGLGVAVVLLLVASGCVEERAPEPSSKEQTPKKVSSDEPAATAKAKPKLAPPKTERPQRKVAAKPVASVPTTPGDPHEGTFTLEEATKGLAKDGKLVATIATDAGDMDCELYEEKAPITVANFVGLARGVRAWRDQGKWVKKPLYDGTVFHRVAKGFMIQGGDPNKNGTGGPGYVIPDEIWDNAHHDERGQLCMANRGPNTNGSQFFIMDGAAPHLDGGYTIFGKCSPESVIEKIASVEVRGDRAVKPVVIKSVKVSRVK